MTSTATAKNLASTNWLVAGRVAAFESSRAYGVVDEAGRMLSTDGLNPSTWSTLRIAKEIAKYQAWPETATWIEPVK